MVTPPPVLEHFRLRDPVIFSVISAYPVVLPKAKTGARVFVDLCGYIIGQQLSARAADTIESRFLGLLPTKSPTATQVLKLREEDVRKAGISGQKAKYIRSLAQSIADGRLRLDRVHRADDAAVIRELTAIPGIGPWTAEMFLIFTLGRPDIFSCGDLALRKAIRLQYNLSRDPSVDVMRRRSRRWAPYRSYAALALWESMDA